MPWIVAGVALVVAALAIAVGTTRNTPASSSTGSGVGARSPVPDLARMTPLERADRLFEAAMIAQESGDTARVRIHAPMALEAYRNLDSLDGDAKYHVGLLRGALGDYEGMLEMADSLQATVPVHLLATTLRKEAAAARGDSAAVHDAYERFLEDYRVESKIERREYMLHQRSIDAFLSEARRAMGESGN